jgi:hypothetical protein
LFGGNTARYADAAAARFAHSAALATFNMMSCNERRAAFGLVRPFDVGL